MDGAGAVRRRLSLLFVLSPHGRSGAGPRPACERAAILVQRSFAFQAACRGARRKVNKT